MNLTLGKSIRDIVRRGIDGADIDTLPKSPLHDLTVIRDIIKDTVSVSFFIRPHFPHRLLTGLRVGV